MKFNIYIILGLLLLLSACGKEDKTNFSKDKDLYNLLASKSPTGTLEGLMLAKGDRLSNIPQDPKNPLNSSKIQLGKLLFHETGLAIDPQNAISMNTYSCASCHHADAGFQSGKRQGIGDGGEGYGISGEGRHRNINCPTNKMDVQPIKSPTVLNSAYQKLMLWNGQFGATDKNIGTESNWAPGSPIANNYLGYEGVETQALAGFDVHRLGIKKDLLEDNTYKLLFESAFPEAPPQALITTQNIALAIAAYERSLLSNAAPYQKWLKGDENVMTTAQKNGMKLFFDKAQCYQCHNGPALNSNEFYALGMQDLEGADIIEAAGAEDAKLGRGGFTKLNQDMYKFKVPQLYNLRDAIFYGHGASFDNIAKVIQYKLDGEKENSNVPNTQLSHFFKKIDLTDSEIENLTDFITNSLYDASLSRYLPKSLPSGNCFPNNDSLSKKEICQ